MKNKVLKFLTPLICALALAACAAPAPAGSSSAADGAAASQSAAPGGAPVSPAPDASAGKTYKVGFVQLAENGAFTEMREGFLNRLKELGYNIELDYKNAQGDVGTLNTICQEMAGSDNDIIATVATPAAQAYVSTESKIPLIFISVSNPVGAGIMGALDKPDKNATGTSNLVPVDEIFKLAQTLTPEVKNFGLLYNSGEANAVSTIENAKKYLDANGYNYTESTIANTAELQQAAQALAEKVQAIYVPIDSSVQAGMSQVTQIAADAGIPVYGSSPVMVQDGALATVSVSDAQVGAQAADIAAKYFEGTPIAEIPAVAVTDFVAVINDDTASALNITVPEALSAAIHIKK